MSRQKISEIVRAQVSQRANGLCEYCHASEQWQYVRFTIEHVVPISQGGADRLDNLAFACFHCNRQKSNRMMAVEPEALMEVPLFSPRRQIWQEHFIWGSDLVTLVGLTATGRATIAALKMNRERILSIRAADVAVDRHPPDGDLSRSD
ncbi:HNH endonuclease [filamentous cyanobacterium LEGE 11480]|uniref:HNH endonuclease n=1 Tax=Romeriopsis navalis LEGE 11480 TaxID=2777977 RepID=A0A928Z532_9CYAN|nr:HNH endonuclease signature motif containing protein [Romeriopsis navalis]MBE9031038.1 HNH endonuclease [Romeriopsis navalis LEGE 11480]